MDPATRAASLVHFLLGRGPSSAEQEKFRAFGFDYDRYLIELLCSDETVERYGNVAEHLIAYARSELASDVLPHKVAHDLALCKEELAKLQAKFDHLNGVMIDLLKHEDRIAGLFEAIRSIQADFNALRGRMKFVEESMLRGKGKDDGY